MRAQFLSKNHVLYIFAFLDSGDEERDHSLPLHLAEFTQQEIHIALSL
jgi:hypothetical protein